jgi:hypothetical protein
MKTNEFTTHDDRYIVASYGNGWAYSITDNQNPDIEPLWFQDHDADQLRAETEDFTNTMVIDMYFEMIGEQA